MSVSDGDTYPYLANGAVTVVDASEGKLRYTPSTNNAQSFTYTASDGNGGTDSAEVTVDVNDDCGKLTVQVEGPNGNLVPGATFTPQYDENADGEIDGKLPEKGSTTGKFTYSVSVSDDPRLSKMNESLMENIPAGYATTSNSIVINKDVEEVLTASGPQDEPDDHTYQNINSKKSKLATNASSSGPPGGGNAPTAVLECEGSQDQTFVNNCQNGSGNMFPANFIGASSTDPDGDIDTYDWQSQSGSVDQTTSEPVDDIQYCWDTQNQDNLSLTVTDQSGNSDTATEAMGDICPVGGGGGCSEVSVQSDFTGDSLDTNSSAQRGANDQSYTSFDNGPKTATLDVSSVLDSGETAGDLTISFAESTVPPNGFTAEVDCDGGIGPEQCGAEAEIDRVDTGTKLRFIDVTGDPNPVDEVHDVSDVTTNVSAGDTVELRTDTYSGISQNHNSEASAEIMVEDITLEVCN